MRHLARFLAFTSFALGGLLTLRLRAPVGVTLLFPKLIASALAPELVVIGALGALLGLASRTWLAFGLGSLGAVAAARHIWEVSSQPDEIARSFGDDWSSKVAPAQVARLRPWRWTLRAPEPPDPHWERDLAFCTVPGGMRRLLCDIWQPAAGVARSGLAFIYFHGSAWCLLDKDYGTRPFFRELAAQGHVVMDVAYRLAPETDIAGMVGDVKRAVAWMKANAASLGVDADRIVLAGGSAGGHLCLLAAYAPHVPELTPDDMMGVDLSVRVAISYYGPTDLRACYHHTRQAIVTPVFMFAPNGLPPGEQLASHFVLLALGKSIAWLGFERLMDAGLFEKLLGGSPDQLPEKYALLSPVSHVHPGCPPTLLVQGGDDQLIPPDATQELADRLRAAGVPVVNIILPHTDHAFDLILPRFSPAAQSALYDVERFLALMAAPRAKAETMASLPKAALEEYNHE